MTQKEKARAYDNALKIAKEEMSKDSIKNDVIVCGVMKKVFPELTESEDERIRKELKHYLEVRRCQTNNDEEYINCNHFLAWLEKQGRKEYALTSCKDEDVRKFMQCIEKHAKAYEFNLPNRSYDIYAFAKDILVWLEKQSELKSSKWAEGDVIRHGGILALVTNGRKAMKSNGECITIQYPDEWVKAETNERKYFFEELEKHGEINLVEILKHYPKETELYSPLYGKLWLAEVNEEHEIITCYKHPLDEGCTRAILEQEDTVSFFSNGTTGLPDFSVSKDCMLFLYNIETILKFSENNSIFELIYWLKENGKI